MSARWKSPPLWAVLITAALAWWSQATPSAAVEEAIRSDSVDAAADGAGSPPAETPTGASAADDTSSPLPAGPDFAPTPASSAETAPTSSDPCADALAAVTGAGLSIPPGWSFACPAPAYGNGREHRGRTCWLPCFGSPAFTIEVNPYLGGSLVGIMAHELCHAVEVVATGTTSEAAADVCAASWGFPNG